MLLRLSTTADPSEDVLLDGLGRVFTLNGDAQPHEVCPELHRCVDLGNTQAADRPLLGAVRVSNIADKLSSTFCVRSSARIGIGCAGVPLPPVGLY